MKLRHGVLLFILSLVLHVSADAQELVKLTLKEAEELALKNHPQVSAAQYNVQAARQIPTEINATRYPNLAASVTGAGAGENTRIASGGLNNPTILSRAASGFSVNQMLFDFGRTENLVASARLRAEAVEQNAEATRAQILLQVDRAYYLCLRTQAILKVANQTVAARQLVVEQAEALQQSGLRSGLDVSFASYNLAESKLLLARAQNDLKAAFAELTTALGSREDQTFELADESLPPAALPEQTALVIAALSKRPELSALQADRDAARQFVKAEKALKWPSVSAVWSAGVSPFRDSKLGAGYNAAGLSISIPIFNGRLFKAREAEATYRAESAAENLREAENRVTRDVRQAWLGADTAARRIELSGQLLSRANESLSLAQERYRLGLSSIVELSQAQLNVTLAELENTNAKYDYLLQRAVLNYQSGQLR